MMARTTISGASSMSQPKTNSAATVLFASLIGTTIEFFDFYIYATAAVLVFPSCSFLPAIPLPPPCNLATFAIAFFARPVGSAVFGHFGDRIGRKATLVAALLTMGISTVVIGLLPTYASIGTLAPALLALCRFGQGLGLGGEWGGAVLLATENAPPGKRAWYGMFPQLGAPIGFFLSGGIFLLLSQVLSDAEFFSYGWRIPFLASSLLVIVGLYIRLKIHETPDFQKVLDKNERVKVPVLAVWRASPRAGAGHADRAGHLRAVLPDDGVRAELGHQRAEILAQGLPDPAAVCGAVLRADDSVLGRVGRPQGRRSTLIWVSAAIAVFGLAMAPLFGSGDATGDHLPVAGPGPDGADLRPAGHHPVRAVPGRGALHRRLADLQPGRHPGRLAGAVRRHLAGDQPRLAVRGLLPVGRGADQPDCIAFGKDKVSRHTTG
jgi:MFS family permease